MHGHVETSHAFELRLQSLLRGIDDHLRSLAEEQLLYFDEPEQATRRNLTGKDFIDLSLLQESNTENALLTQGAAISSAELAGQLIL